MTTATTLTGQWTGFTLRLANIDPINVWICPDCNAWVGPYPQAGATDAQDKVVTATVAQHAQHHQLVNKKLDALRDENLALKKAVADLTSRLDGMYELREDDL